jgi:chemotaxis protein histidine kinase CheA
MQAGTLEIQLLANIARLQQDMDKAKSVVATTMGGIDKAVGVAKTALGALGIGLSVNAFANLIKGSINAQDELAKMSQRVGVSVESLNGLGHAAGLSGTSLDTVQKALKTVSGGMLDAQRGLAGAKENFAALGISVTDSSGALKAADAVMIEVADKFATMKDGTEKAAIATKLFGRAGLDLIPMLNEGSAGLSAMVREGQRLNPVTTASAAQAEMFNDNMDRLKTTMGGFVTQIANSALPRLAQWTDQLVDTINVTNDLVDAQDDYLANIGTMSTQQIAQAIQKTHEDIAAKKQQVAITQALAETTFGYGEKLRQQQRELSDLESMQRVNVAQLNKLKNGYAPATTATEDLTEATEALVTVTAEETAEIQAQAKALADHQKKVRDTIAELSSKQAQLHMTGREQAIYTAMVELGSDATEDEQQAIAAATAALYDQESALKTAGDEWDAMVKELEALGKKQVADAEAAQQKVAKAHEEAAEQAAEEWRTFRNDLSRIFQDTLFDKDGDFFDGIKDAFNDLWKKVLSDMLASGVMKYLTGQGGFTLQGSLQGAGVSGQIVSAGLQKFAPGLASSLGLGAAGTIAAGTAVGGTAGVSTVYAAGAAGAHTAAGLTTSAIGAGSTTAAGAGAGLMSTVGAAIPWIAAAYALYSIFKHDETPSHNAGFLLNAVPGAKADQMFDIAPFESGVAPVGFNRRAGQSETMAVIDAFRDDDARITKLLRGINPNFSANSMNFNGYDEAGLGSGRFIGSAWEEGRPGTALDVQRDSYARQLIAQAAAFLDGEVLNRVLASGNAEAMIAELEKAIGMTEESTKVEKAATRATAGLTDEQERLLDQLYPLRRETREYEADLKTLQGVFTSGTKEYSDAVSRLKDQYKDLFASGYGSMGPPPPGGASDNPIATLVPDAPVNGLTDAMIREISKTQGGGFTLWDMYTSGQLPLSRAVDVLGSSAVYGWIAKHGSDFNPHGSHAAGLDYVPFDGYRAELHRGERVQSAREARAADGMASEIRHLRMVTERLCLASEATAQSSRDTKLLLRRVTRDGQSLVTTPA